MLKLAQTHVIEQLPERTWTERKARLHLVGSRASLAIVEFGDAVTIPAEPRLRITNVERHVGEAGEAGPAYRTLSPPTAFPHTLDDTKEGDPNDGDPYSTTAYSVLLEADLIKPELLIVVEIVEADLYPRYGPTMEWDTAAGDAVLRAAGGRVTDEDGKPFAYGKTGYRNQPFFAAGGG